MTRRLLVLLAVTVAVASSVAYAASLNVSSWHLWAGSQTLTKATCTVTGALADTYVDQALPTTSFGTAATLDLIPSGNTGKQQWTFVEFDLSSCNIPTTGGADSATLSLYLSTAPTTSFNYDLTRVTSAWAGSLTWNQAQWLGNDVGRGRHSSWRADIYRDGGRRLLHQGRVEFRLACLGHRLRPEPRQGHGEVRVHRFRHERAHPDDQL
jgi:hypothetical protein